MQKFKVPKVKVFYPFLIIIDRAESAFLNFSSL